jgi:serine protease Do
MVLAALLSILSALFPSPKQNLAVLSDAGAPICGAVLLSPTLVLTAAHCADAAVMVRCGGQDIPAEVVDRDADEDLLTLDLLFACNAPLSRVASKNPEVGSDVRVQGYPYGKIAQSRGIVSAYEAINLPPYDGLPHGHRIFLKTDAGIDPGNSGGGMYDDTGALVGICSMSRGNFGFYVPASRIRKFVGAVK